MAINDYLSDISSYTGEAKSAADSASQAYAQAAGATATLPAKLKEALGKKLNYNSDLIEQKNKAMGEYFAAPSVAREKYQNIWNPFTREKMVAQDRTQAMQPYATFNDLLTQRMGQVSDVVNEGVSGWQGIVQQAAAIAQAAQQKYQNLLGEYMAAAGMQEKADTMAEQQRQYNESMAWDKAKFAQEFSLKGGAGGGAGSGKSFASMSPDDQSYITNLVDLTLDAKRNGTDGPNVPAKYERAFYDAYNSRIKLIADYTQRAAGSGTDVSSPVPQKTYVPEVKGESFLGKYMAPVAENYPLTNRIISGLSWMFNPENRYSTVGVDAKSPITTSPSELGSDYRVVNFQNPITIRK